MVVTAAVGAGTHGDHPARLRHLVVHLAQRGGHLVHQRAGDDHHVRLTRARAEHTGTETVEIVAHGELQARVFEWFEAALIRRVFLAVGAMRREDAPEKKNYRAEADGDTDKDENGNVILQHSAPTPCNAPTCPSIYKYGLHS